MTDRHFITDSASGTLEYTGGTVAVDSFDPSDAETVTLDSPWNGFFGTDEYVKFTATVAQPIVQSYFHDGELKQFRKSATELQHAQAQIDNLPWTKGHPPDKRVRTSNQIKGFWSDPTYNDGQQADLYIPANDPDSIRFAVTNDNVSVGFSGRLDWEDDSATVDAIQRDMAYDHIASVETGRCPPEKGCGLHTDDAQQHGHVHDAVRTQMTEEDDMNSPQFSEGDWVEWDWSGGTAIGQVETVATSNPVSTSGTSRDPTEAGEPAYKIKHWDDDEFGNMKVAYESNLRSANEPESFADTLAAQCNVSCTVGPCSCGGHDPFADVDINGEEIDLVPPEAAQEAAQDAVDARDDDDVTVNGMTEHGWARAEQLASGEELSPSDIVGSSGAMAPWWSRHEQYSIEGESLKDPETDNPWKDNSYTAGKGWGGYPGYQWAIRKGNEIKRARGDEPVYEDALDLPTFTNGDVVEHQYIDLRGVVAHNPDAPYVMVDPMEDGQRRGATMTFGVGDVKLVERRSMSMSDSVVDTTVMDTITYDGTMGGDLDESAIPNDDYQAHYVFDGDTKSESSFPLVDADGNLRRENVIAAASYSEDAPDEGFLLDVLDEVNDAFDDPPLDQETVTTDATPPAPIAKQDVISTTDTDTTMTDLTELFNDKDVTKEDVIDHYDIEQKESPEDFYDGEPSVEDLADDFDAVDLLVDEKQKLESENDNLSEELHEYRAEEFADRAEDLAALTEKWGDADTLVERFEDSEDEKFTSVDDLDDKIELVKDITDTADETTTVNDTDTERNVDSTDSPDIDTTPKGKFRLADPRDA